MTTHYLDPNGSGGTTDHTNVDDGERDPSTDVDGNSDELSGGGGGDYDFETTTISNNVSSIKIKMFCSHAGGDPSVELTISDAGQGSRTISPGGTATWITEEYTGDWDQDDVDGLGIDVISNDAGSITIEAVYLELTEGEGGGTATSQAVIIL